MAPRFDRTGVEMNMSFPKITHRPNRVIKKECDPYQFVYPYRDERRGIALIYRQVYEDGTCALFAGQSRVRSIRYDIRRSIAHPIVLLDIVGASIPLLHVDPEEEQWLQESLRRPPQ